MKLGVDAIFPMHAARNHDFRTGERLGKKDHIARWQKPVKPDWMTQDEYDEFPDEIRVREVEMEYTKPGFRTKKRILVATFLDPKEVSKEDLPEFYGCRWFVEIALKSIKETMHMDVLRGKTPDMVRKEVWAHYLAYNLVRKIMAQAAIIHGRSPKSLSFKLALQTIRSFRDTGIFSENNIDVYMQLLKAIVNKKVGNRPGRTEPRKIKRRPKSFPRLQKARSLYHIAVNANN